MIEESPKKYKDRNQSLLDFYNSLQKEYIVAELRSKIYPKSKDKKYYRRVMEGKKETIVQISERNHLPNIFSSADLKESIYNEVSPDWGIPNFTYRNKDTELWMQRNDKLNYYGVGSDFAIRVGDDVVIGRVSDNKRVLNHGEVTIIEAYQSTSKIFKIENLKRIL